MMRNVTLHVGRTALPCDLFFCDRDVRTCGIIDGSEAAASFIKSTIPKLTIM